MTEYPLALIVLLRTHTPHDRNCGGTEWGLGRQGVKNTRAEIKKWETKRQKGKKSDGKERRAFFTIYQFNPLLLYFLVIEKLVRRFLKDKFPTMIYCAGPSPPQPPPQVQPPSARVSVVFDALLLFCFVSHHYCLRLKVDRLLWAALKSPSLKLHERF